MPEIQKNAVLSLEIDDLAYGGEGIAKPDGFVVFVKHALPGDRVRARIVKLAKNHASAVIEAIERPSERRIEAPCPLFGTCGGCTWQNLAYEDQLEWKRRQVAETLSHLSGIENLPEVPPVVPSPEIWNYRNKMEFSFGEDDAGELILGFHLPERFDKILEVPRCLLHPEPFDALLSELTQFAREHRLAPHRQRTHGGLLRHAVLRQSKTTGAVVVLLITAEGELPEAEALAQRLSARCPEVTGFLWGVNRRMSDVATIEEERFRWGALELEERMNGLTFRLSPTSFFQTNTLAAARLYQLVVEMAELSGSDRVLDAYCGAGAIGLHCARAAERVVGIDLAREGIWDARENARLNGIANATFLAGTMPERLPLAVGAAGGFTRVVIDPPRGGMDKKSLAALIALHAPVFVYVSCNPSTLARDLATLAEAGYAADALQAIDMFPHTYHIEVVARLRRAGP